VSAFDFIDQSFLLFNLILNFVALLHMCRYLIQRTRSMGKNGVGILDPGLMARGTIDFDHKGTVAGVVKGMNRYSEREMLCTYNPGNHWILIVLSVKRNEVFYLDSLQPRNLNGTLGARDFSEVRKILDEYSSFALHFIYHFNYNYIRIKFPCFIPLNVCRAFNIYLKEVVKNNKNPDGSRRVLIHHTNIKVTL
jgi:hypothetical protein